MNWDELFNSDIEIVSFDVSLYDITKYPKYRNGKRIAWGINSLDDVKDFQEGDLLTGPCGMGPKFFNADDCELRLENLLAISDELCLKNVHNIQVLIQRPPPLVVELNKIVKIVFDGYDSMGEFRAFYNSPGGNFPPARICQQARE